MIVSGGSEGAILGARFDSEAQGMLGDRVSAMRGGSVDTYLLKHDADSFLRSPYGHGVSYVSATLSVKLGWCSR